MADSDVSSAGPDEATLPAGEVLGVEGDVELSDAAIAALPAEVYANSLSEYFQAWGRRLRNGESGAVPVVAGLIAIIIFFQVEQSEFKSSENLVNLLIQASPFIMFGAAELVALLLSEIDLSIGFSGACAAFIAAEINQGPVNLPWWVGVLAALGFCGAVGYLQGTLITRLGLPSFIVTLAGFLALQGVMLELADVDPTASGGVISLPGASPVYKLASGDTMSPALSWVVLAATVAVFAFFSLRRAAGRRRKNLASAPLGVTLLTIGLVAGGGLIVVLVCNANTPSGVPWVVPFVVVVIMALGFMLQRTRFGRYIYAIGSNPEAARRAGINVGRVRTLAFTVVGALAGLSGLVYASRLGSISTAVDPNIVLYAVAAAVIGGTSLFGGRGKPFHALLGGLVIAVVYNGLGLMNVSAAATYLVFAAVLIAAVTLDALVRRRGMTT